MPDETKGTLEELVVSALAMTDAPGEPHDCQPHHH
jgi:hypothetical protein